MPEVYIYVAEGRSVEQKRTVARQMTEVLVENFKVPLEMVVVQFVEAPRVSEARGGVLFSEVAPPTPKPWQRRTPSDVADNLIS
jgi:4-oxalocrotonate tautomerase